MKALSSGQSATYAFRSGRRGRPSKRLPQVVVPLLKHLGAGESRRRAACLVGICPKTLQKWLRTDARLRRSVLKAEEEGRPHAAYLRWFHHPFRGCRPPLPAGQRRLPRPQPRFTC